jgi:magnesium and cobalt transporter
VAELSLPFTIGLGVPALAIQGVTVALARALRVYSRSRLERICDLKGRPERADLIARHDEETERAAESLAIMSGLVIAALAGATAAEVEPPAVAYIVVATVLGIALVGYIAAGPIAPVIRGLAAPLTLVGAGAEWIARQLGGSDDAPPRPASVEVEIPPDDDNPEADEPDLPDSVRAMLEHVVELTRRDVSELMVPRSRMVMRPATISAREAAAVFRTTGLSRIPLYGENRDDIVGILYAKDLFPALLDATDTEFSPRRLARPAYFIPESKAASELLEDLRSRRLQIAVVLDEYGGVVGLITLEDVIEELVGPIDDEHDQPPPSEPIRPLGVGKYEVDATLPLEELNERLSLQLPTEDDITTVGGFVFHALGRLPEPGATFRWDGVEFTVLEVADHSIRRVRLELIGQAERTAR